MSDIYRELILDHFKNPRNSGKLEPADNHGRLENTLCGDVTEFFLKFDGDKVSEVKWSGEGCALSQASASILSDMLVGKTKADLAKMNEHDILQVVGEHINPSRKKCATLGLETVQQAIK